MSYDKGIKRHLLGLLDTGHKHAEMKDMMECSYCGVKFKKAEKEYYRLRKTYPEKFIRYDPEPQPDREQENIKGMLEDRIKQDKLYQNHLKLLATGTTEEKKREVKRINSNYYERHTSDDRPKILIAYQ